MGQALPQVMSTVSGSTTSPPMTPWKPKLLEPSLPAVSSSPDQLSQNSACAESQGTPLWNLTPSRRLKRQRSGATCSQPSMWDKGTTSKVLLSIQVKGSPIISSHMVDWMLPRQPLPENPTASGSSLLTITTVSLALTAAGTSVAAMASVAWAWGTGVSFIAGTAGITFATVGVGAAGAAGASAPPPQATSAIVIRAIRPNAQRPGCSLIEHFISDRSPPQGNISWVRGLFYTVGRSDA